MTDHSDLSDGADRFGPVAAEYDRFRPGYPAEVISTITSAAATSSPRILDLGAGTGQISRAAIRSGADVVAVEPDARMADILADVIGSARVRQGSAEEIPLPDSSVDIVIAAQMWHWVDPTRAVPEVARVLRDGGVFVPLWLLRDDRVDWVAQHNAILDLWDGYRSFDAGRFPSLSPWFGRTEEFEIRVPQQMDEDALVGLISTHSMIRSRADLAELIAATRGLVQNHPDLQDQERFTLPYVCAGIIHHRTARALPA